MMAIMGKNRQWTIGLAAAGLWSSLVMVPSAAAAVSEAAPEQGQASQRPGLQAMKEPPKVVLLTVNGNEITAKDYAEAMQRNVNLTGAAVNTPEGRSAIFRYVVGSQLLKEHLKKEGILKEKQDQQEQTAALKKFADAHFPMPNVLDEPAIFRYYQQHQVEFGIPEMVRVSQIQFQVPDGADENVKQAAKAKGEAAVKRIEAGEDFAKLAGELTENPLGKLTQGDLGYLDMSQNSWLKKSLEGLPQGKPTGLLESPAGFEILKVTDVRPAVITPYANARDKALQRAKVAEQQRLRDAYIAGLAKQAKIEIKDPDVKKLFPNGIFP